VRTILLVGRNDIWKRALVELFPEASTFVAADPAEALSTLRKIDVDVLIHDDVGTPDVREFVREARAVAPTTVILVRGSSSDTDLGADFVLESDRLDVEAQRALDQAFAKNRLLREIATLRTGRAGSDAGNSPHGNEGTPSFVSERAAKQFTRALAAGFDLPRTLDAFLDAVTEFLRPARLALLTADGPGKAYRVRVHRGLVPQIADSVRLSADHGLCHWLLMEGRPARIGDLTDAHVAREITLLQGTMAVPLLARGELVAVLVVGSPVVRSAYAEHDIETLFDLATHVASAIHGITLHHRLQRANEFNEGILEHMASGVLTIGADERVSTMNRRAAEILELDAQAIVGQDLRALPSPLGDMLFETLTTGRARPRTEIRLTQRGLSLEVSTYPVRGDDATGAVLVFEDLTAQKELATQKRNTEQLDLLTHVVARIADEIKNPLVSVNTFMELIGERFDDPDFRQHFHTVVGGDVRRLVQVFEKLTGLVNQGEMNFTTVDVHGVVDDAVAAVQPIDVHVTREPAALLVKVDPAQLRKALSYLVGYLGHHSPERAAVSVSVGKRADGGDGPDDIRIVVGSRSAAVPALELDRLFDPVRMVQESLIDIGPAVSQRIVEALGGRLELRQGKHDLAFVLALPAAV
jgi:signal transduction histidine kinase